MKLCHLPITYLSSLSVTCLSTYLVAVENTVTDYTGFGSIA